ncbi:hypothetical protein CAPTEDRAFT_217684 [Capitella teleta]|uniref:Uncharacterized protein n=1 Tax=Capitella teleta TaxID=283909 RepID=X2AMJ2_CAPTE|nr:hypothetical protein CAPTEDRAFT_217684 [Capitella teleta]|eukprot:ELU00301.1 hypothetical protein CAPTEDRAFT_217684 [Capitella teleta]
MIVCCASIRCGGQACWATCVRLADYVRAKSDYHFIAFGNLVSRFVLIASYCAYRKCFMNPGGKQQPPPIIVRLEPWPPLAPPSGRSVGLNKCGVLGYWIFVADLDESFFVPFMAVDISQDSQVTQRNSSVTPIPCIPTLYIDVPHTWDSTGTSYTVD